MTENFQATLRPYGLRASLASSGAIGSIGPPGPQGPAGPQGPPGAPGGYTQQSVVTANRSANTVYRNTGATAMFVLTTWDLTSNNATVEARTDATTPPTTEVARVRDPSTSGAITAALPMIVLSGNYYMCAITGGTPTLLEWVEYQ